LPGYPSRVFFDPGVLHKSRSAFSPIFCAKYHLAICGRSAIIISVRGREIQTERLKKISKKSKNLLTNGTKCATINTESERGKPLH